MQTLTQTPATPEILHLLGDHESKLHKDLRDRAAYVHITGIYPTHLRTQTSELLRGVTHYARWAAMDGEGGAFRVDDEAVRELELDEHPMVRKVAELLSKGWRIVSSRDTKARRPYSRVFMYREKKRGMERVSVYDDGAVKDGW